MSTGHRNSCKTCDNTKTAAWRNKNREQYNAQMAKFQELNPEKVWATKLAKYGITIEEWDRVFAAQNGLCAICKKPETNFDKRHKIVRKLSVDHCHKTGKVRGLLCGKCNNAIGLLNDDPDLLDAGSHYLKFS